MTEKDLNLVIERMSADQLKDYAKIGLLLAFDMYKKAIELLRKI